MQGLFNGSGLPVPAQPSGSAAADEDFGPRSATDMVVGGAMRRLIRRANECPNNGEVCFAGTILTSKTGAKCLSHLLTHGLRYMAPMLYCDPNLLMA